MSHNCSREPSPIPLSEDPQASVQHLDDEEPDGLPLPALGQLEVSVNITSSVDDSSGG